MDENWKKECTVGAITECPICGSTEYEINVYASERGISVAVKCFECGYYGMLPHKESLRKRTNTSLVHYNKRVKEKDGYRCYICGNTEDLEVHHLIPVSHDRAQMLNVRNGITLCQRCHLKVHNKPTEEDEG